MAKLLFLSTGSLETNQAALMLRCTGSTLYDLGEEKRMALTNEIWAKLNDLGQYIDDTSYIRI